MGCGDAAVNCERAVREDTVFRTEAACLAETEEVPVRQSDRPFPILVAEYQNVSAQIAAFRGDGASQARPRSYGVSRMMRLRCWRDCSFRQSR